MKTFIVLIPLLLNRNARAEAELVEASNIVIGGAVPVTAMAVHNRVSELIGHDKFEVEPITDYMDRFNDTDLDPDVYFMSYVFA